MRFRAVQAIVDMRPEGDVVPEPEEHELPFRALDGVLVAMRPLEVLNELPAPLLAVWTRRLRAGYGGAFARLYGDADEPELGFVTDPGWPDFDGLDVARLLAYPGDALVGELRDQSGASNDLSALDADGPTASREGGPEVEDRRAVLRFDGQAALRRGDALGLDADPALTVAWQMVGVDLYEDQEPRAILSLGTAAEPELRLMVQRASGQTVVMLVGPDMELGGQWPVIGGTFDRVRSYVLTKPAGTGYDAASWRLWVDGHDQGAPPLRADGALVLGDELTSLGADPIYAGYECALTGVLLWDQVLGVHELARLDAFLSAPGGYTLEDVLADATPHGQLVVGGVGVVVGGVPIVVGGA